MLDIRRVLVLATLFGSGLTNSCKHHQNDNPNPSGNPISQPLVGASIPVGKAYDISWRPTSAGPVSIVLLRGPSDHAVEYICIAESIPNSGSFSWTPPKSLEDDKSHYGLKIIVDDNGDYQYSPQFGIENPRYHKGDEKKDDDDKGKGDSKKKDKEGGEKKEGKHEKGKDMKSEPEGTSTKYVSAKRTHTKTRSHTRYCPTSPCPGATSAPGSGEEEMMRTSKKPGHKPSYPTGHNSTMAHPTSTSRPSLHSSSKPMKSTSKSKSKTKTSTTVRTSTVAPSSTSSTPEFTNTQATPEATPPPIVTAEPSSPAVQSSNSGNENVVRLAGVLFAGVAAAAWFAL